MHPIQFEQEFKFGSYATCQKIQFIISQRKQLYYQIFQLKHYIQQLQNKQMQFQPSQPFTLRNEFHSTSSSSTDSIQRQPLVQEMSQSSNNSIRLISKNRSQSQSSPTHMEYNSHQKQRAYYTKQQIYNHDIVYVNSDEFSNSPSFLKMSIENTPILRKKDSLNISVIGMPGVNNNSSNTVANVPNYQQSNQLDNTIRLDDMKRSSHQQVQINFLKQQKTYGKEDIQKIEDSMNSLKKQEKNDKNQLRNQSFVQQQNKNGNGNENKIRKKINPRNMIQNRNRSLSEYQIENIIKIVDTLYEKAIDKKIKVQVNLQIESKSLQKIKRQKQNKKQMNVRDKKIQKENEQNMDSVQSTNKKQCLKQVTNIDVNERVRKILTSSKHSEQNEKQIETKTIRCSINLQQLKLMKQIKQLYNREHTDQNPSQQLHQQENQEYQNYNVKYYDIIVNQNDDDKGLSTTQRVSIEVLPQQYKCKEQDEIDDDQQQLEYQQSKQWQQQEKSRKYFQQSSESQHSYQEGKINTHISSQKWFKTDSQSQQNRIENPILETIQAGKKINYQVYPCECHKSMDTAENKKSCRKVYIKNSNQMGAMTPIKNINNHYVNNSRNNSAGTPNTGNYNNIRLIQLDPARFHKYEKKDELQFGDDKQKLSSREPNTTQKKGTKKNGKNINYTLIKYEQNEQNKEEVNLIKYKQNVNEKNKQNKGSQYMLNNNLSLPTQVYTNISIRTNLNLVKQFEPQNSAKLLELCQYIKQQDKEIENCISTQRRTYADSKFNSGSVTERQGVDKSRQNNCLNKYDLNIMNGQGSVGNKTDRSSGSIGRTNKNSSRTNKSTTCKNSMYKGVYEQILSEYSTAKLLAISKKQYSNENTLNLGQQASGTGSMNRTQLYPHSHYHNSNNNSASNSNIVRNSNAYETNYNEGNVDVGSIIKNNQNKNKNIVKNIISNRKQENSGMGVCFINEQPQICSYGTYNGKHTNTNHNMSKTGNIIKQQYKSNKYYFQKNV